MIKDIIKKIKAGSLTRETDESGASGFWDYAYEITEKARYKSNIMQHDYQDMVELVYNTLWEIVETK